MRDGNLFRKRCLSHNHRQDNAGMSGRNSPVMTGRRSKARGLFFGLVFSGLIWVAALSFVLTLL
jgi:hypothetical protein